MIDANFGDKHREYIRKAVRSTMSVAEGAVRSGKTIDNLTAFAYLIDRGVPDRIHLVTGSTVGNAKLNVGDANGYGLEYIFRGRCKWTTYKDNPALAIRSHGREYIVVFAGGGLANSYKRIRGNSYGMWLATEVNLHHESMIREAFNRQLAAKVRRVFWDLNPTSPGDWIYRRHIDRFAETYGEGYNYQHFTIHDNASIPSDRIEEIERQYVPGTIWHRRDILGERCIAEGLVYQMDAERYVCKPGDVPESGGRWYVSIDYGITNPFAALLWYVTYEKAYITAEYYFDSSEEGYSRTDSEHLDAVESLVGDRIIDEIIIDPSATSFKEEMYRRRKWDYRNADNSVRDGIPVTYQMLHEGHIKISETCANTLREMQLYRWDPNANGDSVVKRDDHCITGDTLIATEHGDIPIAELVGKSGMVWSHDGERAVLKPFHDVRMTREMAEVYEIATEDGRTLRCTGDHLIMTERGWVECKNLTKSDRIVSL